MIQRDIDADLNRVNEAGRSMARLAAMTIFVSRPTSHLGLSGRSTTTSSRLRLFASVITAQSADRSPIWMCSVGGSASDAGVDLIMDALIEGRRCEQ